MSEDVVTAEELPDELLEFKKSIRLQESEKIHPVLKKIDKYGKNPDLQSLFKTQNLSLMELFLIGQLYDLYLSEDCVLFWETERIFKFEKRTVEKKAKRKSTHKAYPQLNLSFPNIRKGVIKKILTKDSVSIVYYIPEKTSRVYEIYKFLDKPQRREYLDEFLLEFSKKYDFSLDYLNKFISKIAQFDLGHKFVVNRETLYQNIDRLGFFLHFDAKNLAIFHIGENCGECLELLTYISMYGLSPLALEHCFVNSGLLKSKDVLSGIKTRLKKRGKIVKEIYLSNLDTFQKIGQSEIPYNTYRINLFFHRKIKERQVQQRVSGPAILQIEKYNSIMDIEADQSEKFSKILHKIRTIQRQGFEWIPRAKYENYRFFSSIILKISKTTRRFDDAANLLGFAQFETELEQSKRRYWFYKAECSKGFIIYTKDKENNPLSNIYETLHTMIKKKLNQRSIKTVEGNLNAREAFKSLKKWHQERYLDVRGEFIHGTRDSKISSYDGVWQRFPEIDAWLAYSETIEELNIHRKYLLLISIKDGIYTDRDQASIKLAAKQKNIIIPKFNARGHIIIPILLVNKKDYSVRDDVEIWEYSKFGYKPINPDDDFDTSCLETVCTRIAQEFESRDRSIDELPVLRENFISAQADQKINGFKAVIITDENGDVIWVNVNDGKEKIQAAGAKNPRSYRDRAGKWKLTEQYLKQFKHFPLSTFVVEILCNPAMKNLRIKHEKELGYVDLEAFDKEYQIVILDVYRFKGQDYIDPNFANTQQRRELLETHFPELTKELLIDQILCIPKSIRVYNNESSMRNLLDFAKDIQASGLYPHWIEGIILKTNDYSLKARKCHGTVFKIKGITSITYDLLVFAIRAIKSKNSRNQDFENRKKRFQAIMVAQDENGGFVYIGTMFIARRYLINARNKIDRNISLTNNILNNWDYDFKEIIDFNIIISVQFRAAPFTETIKTIIPIEKRSGINATNIDLASKILKDRPGYQGIWKSQYKNNNVKAFKRLLDEYQLKR